MEHIDSVDFVIIRSQNHVTLLAHQNRVGEAEGADASRDLGDLSIANRRQEALRSQCKCGFELGFSQMPSFAPFEALY